ncbi:mevalonate kinase [Neptunomonas phycophila]|jgi:mevalonate kinase|uniref:mevalonate kinase n=1 Tax=Neptunomonas phycophila TaxID=1572645 RepID=UPI0015BF85D3|nr:mevalonate kinase [Neptunomonas phycophila]QLE98284.1 mevalonate kinase [Neptunomonas phycophila]
MSVIKASAPGSIMVMGEHAVLFGHRAIACAVDKRIYVSLAPRKDRQVSISSALASYESSLDQLTPEPKLSFVLYAIQQVAAILPSGFDLTIESEFSHTVGLGSSAAVTASVVAVLAKYAGDELDSFALFERALSVVHGVQGRGSGTDLAASVYGGLIAYTVEPREVMPLSGLPPISLFYCGYKTRTPDVLKIVERKANEFPDLYRQIYRLMNDTSEQAEQAIQAQAWDQLGALMNIYQGLLDALGVSDHSLCDIIYTLRGCDNVWGAKISGSGLGDCVITLGRTSDLPQALADKYEEIPVAISKKGTQCDVV